MMVPNHKPHNPNERDPKVILDRLVVMLLVMALWANTPNSLFRLFDSFNRSVIEDIAAVIIKENCSVKEYLMG
jgi:hypothetical protein